MGTSQQVPLKPDKTQLNWGYILVPILLGFLGHAQQMGRGDIGGAIASVVGAMFLPALMLTSSEDGKATGEDLAGGSSTWVSSHCSL